MNQVTELLQMASPARLPEAISRLTTLFDLFRDQPGFLSAEVVQSTEQPERILVIHTWEALSDWVRFQSSEAKINFSATRPDSLYSFLACGMNWQVEAATGTDITGRYVSREIVRGELEPATGPGIGASRVGTYLDYEPQYQGTTMRLTWMDGPHTALFRRETVEVVSDERYESAFKYAFDPARARAVSR